jgi:2',3'-cyclic-nucleotide 2'-phosphodiesterase (5'-nucleotidase family)
MKIRPAQVLRDVVFLFSILPVLGGCTSAPIVTPASPPSVLPPGRVAPTPPPRAYRSSTPDTVTIAVVGINDFHGHLISKERKLPDGRVIKSGGAPALTTMLRILRDEMEGNVLLVDAGDEWQGTIESNQVKGSIVVDYFHRIGMNVATLGNHEFDFGIQTLKENLKSAMYPYVSSNIFDKKTGKRLDSTTGFSNLYPSQMMNLGGIKIGVIGAATQETPRATRYDVVKYYDFRNPQKLIEQESQALRKQGAGAVLLTTHAGSRCEKREDLQDWRLWTADVEQGTCLADSEINEYFARLKPGSLDGAILGHTHQVIHHWIQGVPAVEDEAFNQFFNILYLTFDKSTGQVIPQETRIEGLIPICSEFFEGTDHCDTRRLPDGYSPGLRPANFHGQKVTPDPDVEAWLQPILQSTEKYRKEVVATAAAPIAHPPFSESMFGNLVANILRDKGKADFSLVNERGIRNPLEAGPITADALYRALPFDNLLNVIRIKGRDVKTLYRIATSGAHQIWSFAGLRIKIIPIDRPAPKTDLNGDGKLDVWETNRILEITREDGTPIQDNQEYSVATFDYLVSGGDNMAWFMSRIPKKKIETTEAGYTRELVIEYLRQEKVVNTPEKPLIDPKKPRLILASPEEGPKLP